MKKYRPELIFALCGASGTDIVSVEDALISELRSVQYNPRQIKLSKLMQQVPDMAFLKSINFEDERIKRSMEAGNRIRELTNCNDAMVRLAIARMHEIRAEIDEGSDGSVPAEGVCFLISSLKRKEEIDTLRALYGRRVFLISVYETSDKRIENLSHKIARSRNSSDLEQHRVRAQKLSEIDKKETNNKYGQRLEDVFSDADVFFRSGEKMRGEVRRFIQLLFGAPFITPTIDERLMFHAKSNAQRSADLSRQVGAVIANQTGEILSTGCNEVPKAGGGVNWDNVAGTDADYRDYKFGQDSAAAAKKEIVAEIFERLIRNGWIAPDKTGMTPELLAQLALFSDQKPLAGSAVTNILEFGRIVHAEMAAICDAALRGVPLKNSTLYCTTFPCHMCARHIIASGITKVVFIEPFPKSRAKKLYKRAIRVDEDREADNDAVDFASFVGVAPSRFLDLFEMVPRKDAQGYARSENASLGIPKGVAGGSLSVELESEYLLSLSETDWKRLPPLTEKAAFDEG